MELIEKAWTLDFSKLDVGTEVCIHFVTAKTVGKAMASLLAYTKQEEIRLSNGEEITFLNIPVKRCPEWDVVMFEGERTRRSDAQRLLFLRERREALAKMLADHPDRAYYIFKYGRYYRPGSRGYTESTTEAGVYCAQEAVEIAMRCEDILLVVADTEARDRSLVDLMFDERVKRFYEALQTRKSEVSAGLNHSTACHVYIVYDFDERVVSGHSEYNLDAPYGGGECVYGFIDNESDDRAFSETSQGMSDPEEVTLFYMPRFVALFFTHEAAKEYMQKQAHNLSERALIWTEYAGYANSHMEGLLGR